MTTGAFAFQPTVGFTSQSVGYVLIDGDGDTANNTMTFTSSGGGDQALIVRDDLVVTNIIGSGAATEIRLNAATSEGYLDGQRVLSQGVFSYEDGTSGDFIEVALDVVLGANQPSENEICW